MKSYKLYFLFLVFLTLMISGCGGVNYVSKWNNSRIKIDGNDNDWKNNTEYIKDKNILVGVQNDKNDLYVLFETSDRAIEGQIMRGGLILWLDRSGGSSKKFGIKYPLSMRDERQTGGTELEFYNPDNDSWERSTFKEAKGINIAFKRDNEKFVYEMKIDLHPGGNSYFLNAKADEVGVGFAAGKIERRQRSSFEGGGREGGFGRGEGEGGESGEGGFGGRGFGGRGGRGGYGGGEGGQRPQQAEPLDFWMNVHLAAGTAAASK